MASQNCFRIVSEPVPDKNLDGTQIIIHIRIVCICAQFVISGFQVVRYFQHPRSPTIFNFCHSARYPVIFDVGKVNIDVGAWFRICYKAIVQKQAKECIIARNVAAAVGFQHNWVFPDKTLSGSPDCCRQQE